MSEHPAEFTVHWPTGLTHCCVRHARGLVRLGQMLGSHIAATKAPEGAECTNCVNEAKSAILPASEGGEKNNG